MPRHRTTTCIAVFAAVLLSCALVRADGVRLLDRDYESLEARLWLIASAQHTIDASYFAIDDDPIGRNFSRALIQAARRGVQVRLLIDGTNDLLNASTRAALIDAGVQIREYHPLRLTKPHWTPYRMHDKLLVGDGTMMILGGRNISAAYFGMSSELRFSDRDVLIVSAVAAQAAAYYERRWNTDDCVPIEADCQRRYADNLGRIEVGNPYAMPAPQATCRPAIPEWLNVCSAQIGFLHSGVPQSDRCGDISTQLLALLERARANILIEAPYLVLTTEFEQAISAAIARGVRVQIVTNSLGATNQIAAQAGYEAEKKKLLRMGIELWEYQGPDTLHSKCWVVDDYAVIGSYNLDERSANYDTQTAIVIRDCAVATALAGSIVCRHLKKSIQPTLEGEALDPFGVRQEASKKREAILQSLRPTVPLIRRHL